MKTTIDLYIRSDDEDLIFEIKKGKEIEHFKFNHKTGEKIYKLLKKIYDK
jgi:hypothetical protein